jgi:hypothetical protein
MNCKENQMKGQIMGTDMISHHPGFYMKILGLIIDQLRFDTFSSRYFIDFYLLPYLEHMITARGLGMKGSEVQRDVYKEITMLLMAAVNSEPDVLFGAVKEIADYCERQRDIFCNRWEKNREVENLEMAEAYEVLMFFIRISLCIYECIPKTSELLQYDNMN